MRITNRTRNSLLGTRVVRAATFWSRTRGFIGRPEPRRGEGILLNPCSAIHTHWMSFSLDVLFLDDRGKVLKLVRSISPWNFTRRVPGARYALEVPVGTIDTSSTHVGDELTWREPSPYSISVLSQTEGQKGSTSTLNRRSTG
jgi:uncharacterized membrane protein (UPF0127 family)